jgi:hypothetical protein
MSDHPIPFRLALKSLQLKRSFDGQYLPRALQKYFKNEIYWSAVVWEQQPVAEVPIPDGGWTPEALDALVRQVMGKPQVTVPTVPDPANPSSEPLVLFDNLWANGSNDADGTQPDTVRYGPFGQDLWWGNLSGALHYCIQVRESDAPSRRLGQALGNLLGGIKINEVVQALLALLGAATAVIAPTTLLVGAVASVVKRLLDDNDDDDVAFFRGSFPLHEVAGLSGPTHFVDIRSGVNATLLYEHTGTPKTPAVDPSAILPPAFTAASPYTAMFAAARTTMIPTPGTPVERHGALHFELDLI